MNTEDSQFYGDYAPGLEQTEQWLVSQLQTLLDTISTDPELCPAEHITSRIKHAESLRRKLTKQGLTPDAQTALSKLHDVIGVRLVVHFFGDVYLLRDAILACPLWQVDEIRDYIEKPKANGYRSLHILVTLPFPFADRNQIQAEIQLRTSAMDCWASLEHQICYKKQISHESLIQQELSRCAAEIASVDLTMQTIREQLAEEKA